MKHSTFQYMVRSILPGMLVFISAVATAQVQTHVVGDSVRIHSNSGNGELVLENSTKNVNGFLYNKGNGRTEFREGLVKVNDSVYVSGPDTLKLKGGWSMTGNSGINAATNFLGTKDSAALSIRTKNQQHLSVLANGVVNIASDDSTPTPVFRFYPNGDFASGTNNNYGFNQNHGRSGIRYNKKMGIFEIGISNNLDTVLGYSQGVYQTSGLIINSDSSNLIKSPMISTIIAGDGMRLDSASALNWSLVAGEQHHFKGAVAKSIVNGHGHTINGGIVMSIVSGLTNTIDSLMYTSIVTGTSHKDIGPSANNIINGNGNQFLGFNQFVSGIGLVSKSWASTTLGSANVDFSSLSHSTGAQPANLKDYPVLAIGNSDSVSGVRSNALTVLYNGRTQINTTGYHNNLSQTDVTPKAALEIVSKTSGILIPRLTYHQRDSISGGDLQNGLMIYNTDSSNFQYYNGTRWRSLADISGATAVQTLKDSSTLVWNIANGDNAGVTLKGTSRTVSISNPVPGRTYHFKIAQDSTGSRTIGTWPTNTLWSSGIPPSLSTSALAIDMVTLYYDGSNYFGDSKLLYKPVSTGVSVLTYNAQSGFASTVHSLTSVPAGTLLVVTTTAGSATQNATVSSSPSLTWTKRVDASHSTSGDAEIYTAVFTAGGSITVTSDWGDQPQSSVCYEITGQETTLGGATATGTQQGTPSVSITTTRANSIIIAVTSDWNAMTGTHVYSGSPTETQYAQYSGTGVFYHYYKPVTTATSYTLGMSLPTGQSSGTALLEIRGN